jgi:hypothetical protein
MGASHAVVYDGLVVLVLSVHLLWILWVIFGALFTRGRPGMAAFHIASLLWGIVVETGPWPCPLTLSEQYFQLRAGLTPYRGSFLIHYLDRVVYPDVPVLVLTVGGVAVCGINLLVYLYRGYRFWRDGPARGGRQRGAEGRRAA